jgi:hypothetical protein
VLLFLSGARCSAIPVGTASDKTMTQKNNLFSPKVTGKPSRAGSLLVMLFTAGEQVQYTGLVVCM